MKKTLIAIVLVLAAGAASAVELFPSVNVTAEQRARVYKAVCMLTGYYEGTEEAKVTNPDLWVNNAGMAAHVKAFYVQQAKDAVKSAEKRRLLEAVPDPPALEVP